MMEEHGQAPSYGLGIEGASNNIYHDKFKGYAALIKVGDHYGAAMMMERERVVGGDAHHIYAELFADQQRRIAKLESDLRHTLDFMQKPAIVSGIRD